MQHDGCAYCIDSIYEPSVYFGACSLANKIFQKNWPVQCNSGVVESAKKCAEGVKMNRSLFLLNQLLVDVFSAQDKEHSFSYSWLLILIALVAWMEEEDY